MMFASRLKYGLILAAIALATGVGWRVTGPNASATPADRNPPAISATADHKKSAIDQLQGTWTLVAAVHDGVVLKKHLDSYHWTVIGDRLESFSGSGAVRTHAKIVISTDHNLQTIDFSAAMPDQSLPEWQTFNFAGIYRIERTAEGETLTVCFDRCRQS